LVWAVGLVRNQQDRLVDLAKSVRNFAIQRDHTGPRIDHEQQHIGIVDGCVYLRLDLRRQVIDILDTDPPGIDQLKMPIFMLYQGSQSIASDPSHVLDNGQTAPRKPIKNRTFADVGSADNCNTWNWHSIIRFIKRPIV
jgi:hypothetical protein